LLPLGQVLEVERGAPLQDFLFGLGVEFPCGGRGRCKGCRIKVLAGSLPVSEDDRARLSRAELESGWRLACRARAEDNLKLDLAQWETTILSDDSTFEFSPRPGFGVAVDVGTTTLVAQLLNLETGRVLGVRTALNDQARHGADIMSRVEFAVTGGGQPALQALIRDQIGGLIRELLTAATPTSSPPVPRRSTPVSEPQPPTALPLESIVLVGNTVMHHLFCGISVEPLSQFPFEPASPGLQVSTAASLGWRLSGEPTVYFLPCFGGFVGSDVLAGVLATRLHEREQPSMLIDLGTNGEIIVGNRDRLLCAATAAGPAFEGARISMGMRAATGAISEVRAVQGRLHCHILGHTTPRGICGSGLVDAVATGLDLGLVRPNGRFATGETLELAPPVSLNQWDIRELQLAKGAIAAGVRLLLEQWGAQPSDLDLVFLAGAFGNYINQANARRIGLFQFPPEKIVAAGNTALLGAKLALFNLTHEDLAYPGLQRKTTHLSLHEAPGFQEAYVEEMTFPAAVTVDGRHPGMGGSQPA
jgi:uncharacterized 2Fe-2S/4Fe-4S cluster protein (DUF4445 family)